MTAKYDPRYVKGIEHFNRQEYFEAHDVWEELWREMKGDDSRIFYQGLIQVAVALHHYRNGNYDGAGRMWAFAVERLEGYTKRHEGLDVAPFMEKMWDAIEGTYPDSRRPYDASRVPRIRLDSDL